MVLVTILAISARCGKHPSKAEYLCDRHKKIEEVENIFGYE